MFEPQDIQKLMEVLATKDDICRIEDRLTTLEETVSNLVTVTDHMVGRMEMLHQEYLVLK